MILSSCRASRLYFYLAAQRRRNALLRVRGEENDGMDDKCPRIDQAAEKVKIVKEGA